MCPARKAVSREVDLRADLHRLMSLAVEPRGRLLRDRSPLSQIFGSTNSTPSSAPDSQSLGVVQNASVFASATPPVPADPASVMTIRAAGEVSPDDSEEHYEDALDKTPTIPHRPLPEVPIAHAEGQGRGELPAASTEDAPNVQEAIGGGDHVIKRKEKLRTRYSMQREQEREDEAADLPDRVMGTHRFTVITKSPETSNHKKAGSKCCTIPSTL